MNLLKLREKVNKGIDLGAEVVYIKENNKLFGIDSIEKIEDSKNIIFIKSEGNSLICKDFINIIEKIYKQLGDINACIGEKSNFINGYKSIDVVEFAQYENIKMLFLNAY